MSGNTADMSAFPRRECRKVYKRKAQSTKHKASEASEFYKIRIPELEKHLEKVRNENR
jgi:hypothetical protein